MNGQRITGEEKLEYVLLNKPRGYITSVRDEKGRPVVTELTADVDARLFLWTAGLQHLRNADSHK